MPKRVDEGFGGGVVVEFELSKVVRALPLDIPLEGGLQAATRFDGLQEGSVELPALLFRNHSPRTCAPPPDRSAPCSP